MYRTGSVLVVVCLVLMVSVSVDGQCLSTAECPLQVITARLQQCVDSAAHSQGAGQCLTPLLQQTLDDLRGSFRSGLRLTSDGWPGQLEPLHVNIPAPARARSENSRPTITDAQLEGLSTAQLEHIHLNESHAVIQLAFPRLQASGRLHLTTGLFPLRPRITVDLAEPVVTVSGQWNRAQTNASTLLTQPRVSLEVRDFRVQIRNLLTIGGNIENKLNDASLEIIDFLKPSFDALILNKLTQLQHKYSHELSQYRRLLS